MTELQLGLIGLGAAAVAGVLGFNKWQESRHRKAASKVLQGQHEDVLLGRRPGAESAAAPDSPVTEPALAAAPVPLDTVRQEPVLGEPAAQVADAPTSGRAAEEPVDPVVTVSHEPEACRTAPTDAEPRGLSDAPETVGDVPASLLDPRLEFIVTLELVEPERPERILRAQRETLDRLTKPVHWVGFNDKTREWELLQSDSPTPVRRLRIGLQLVNRLGPVTGADLAVFTGAMQGLADELMAVADMPPSRVLDQAAEVDRFCAAVDLEIGLNLVSKGSAFSGTKIRALAEAAGMTLEPDGLFTRYDDAGRVQFCLQNYESTRFSPDTLRNLTTHGLTFLLDVPRVDHGERVFQQMTEVARRFADTLQGVLVDDNRQPLNEAQLDHIRREFIGKPQSTMNGFGLPAGSSQALRLFS